MTDMTKPGTVRPDASAQEAAEAEQLSRRIHGAVAAE